ncbi:V-type proton ATPase, partial [Clarias magur]
MKESDLMFRRTHSSQAASELRRQMQTWSCIASSGIHYGGIYQCTWQLQEQCEIKALEQELTEINSNLTELLEIRALLGIVHDFQQVWNIASNKLSFLNSYKMKMKMAIVIGVCHMTFGISEMFKMCFVPEVIFLLSLFGYLVFLILHDSSSILLIYINMIFFNYPANEKLIYSGQKAVQIFPVVQALLMVPVMFLIKPLLTYRREKKRSQTRLMMLKTSMKKDEKVDILTVIENE